MEDKSGGVVRRESAQVNVQGRSMFTVAVDNVEIAAALLATASSALLLWWVCRE